ncbi:VOC family protein [Leucobacter iarius]|uniref:VOC family protein n=1 Tax=Leucobacter iarius TaxID=333963 RepID=A0ABP4XL74_9MICO
MQWNPLVPEISVSDFAKSLRFYTEGVGFSVAFTRTDPDFAYFDLDGAQLMLEADHDESWRTGAFDAPRGRGLNLQLEVGDVRAARDRLAQLGATVFRDLQESWYETADGPEGQLEHLVQDPDGYLVRLVEILDPPASA